MELKKGFLKRVLSLALAASMLLSNIPVGVFAQEEQTGSEPLAGFETIWNGSQFAEDSEELRILLDTLDGVSGLWGMLVNIDSNWRENLLPGRLEDALGLRNVFDGIERSSDIGLPDELLWAEKTIQGNQIVLYFAEDAAGRTVEEIRSGTDYFLTLLAATGDRLDLGEAEPYFLELLSDEERMQYEWLSDEERQYVLADFCERTVYLLGIPFTGMQLIAMMRVAEEMRGGYDMSASAYCNRSVKLERGHILQKP